jgi:hypothetical protein
MSAVMDRPLIGRRIFPEQIAGLTDRERAEFLRAMRAAGVLPAMCGGSAQPAMVSQPDPFGVTVDADGRVVVDDFTNPISNIPALVRQFARSNEGYWIEDVFTSPGWTVQGGAVRYSLSMVGDHFLPAGQTLRPRAPGAEAPRISGSRRRPIVGYPESISASIEVTDEARERNNIIQVQTTFRQAANTFTETFQDLGEAALDALVTAGSREVTGGAGTFADWAAAPTVGDNTSTAADSAMRPSREFARVRRLFVQEKGGVLPDTIVWAPEDAEEFDRVYEDRGAAILARYGLTRQLTTVRRPPGQRLYLRSGQVGVMAWEKPVGDPEYTREGTRWTDVYSLEGRVIFVANGADAVLRVRKV